MSSSPQPAQSNAPYAQLERYYPAIIIAAAIVTYVATLRFGFVYDDNQQILNNPLIRSWHNLPLIFKTDVWRFWHPSMVGNYWRPLFMTWLLVNYKLFGPTAAGWHATAVLVHALATYLGYRLVKRITGDPVVALTAGLIFAVHPAHLETVAWISGVTDSLMAVFFVGALLCFVNGYQQEHGLGIQRLITSSLLFACSLLCKETAAVLPVVVAGYVLLVDRQRLAHRTRRVALAISLYATVFIVYWLLRRDALAGVGHSAVQLGAIPVLLTWPSLVWFYISHLFWPLGLSVLYDRLPVLHADWRHFWQPLLAILLGVVAVAASLRREQRKLGVFAALLVIGPLAPALVLPALLPTDYAHDRYLYLPCLGFALLVGILLQRIPRYPAARVIAALVIVIALTVATSAQVVYWANDLLLFDRATKIAPGNLNAFNNLANALIDRGQTNQAVAVFRQILQANPNNWPALYNLGLYDFQNAHYAEAEDLLRRATAARTDDSDALALFADTLNHEGKYAEAETAIRRALRLRPQKPGYHRVLAESLYGEGECGQALEQIRTELQAYPEEHEAMALLQRWRCEH